MPRHSCDTRPPANSDCLTRVLRRAFFYVRFDVLLGAVYFISHCVITSAKDCRPHSAEL
jgi:hypothetical protein